ncbi:sigma-54-dependent transcriptional regulator [Patiriisocius hiemis]|uniref:Sigma-54 dependent transcriptional regulator n=1 Tax=Patiriisocius hiemis TaxID=3075604 RepID=A0ABU2YFH4_9FLAO|nr:sigma-54 dependent transcriptional regulator [Constantimarinum sp. W242]MDT0556424.1 sigma-54 dependent transcriptional regulator [Constantimarinum sp. W242]
MSNDILIIEDDIAFGNMLKTFLERKGLFVSVSSTKTGAEKIINSTSPALIITDIKLPDGSGMDILKFVKDKYPSIAVVLMTGYAEVTMAVEAIKKGALDYISKPFRPEELLMVINQVLKEKSNKKVTTSKKNNSPLKKTSSTNYITGSSEAAKKNHQYIQLVGPTTMSVLVQGESGTGKEVVAKTIHDFSDRKEEAFIAVDCGAIPKEIASSEFFGHVKGSFTGAINDKKGHFEAAHRGTLFLDEVGNLSYENQVQLLRALQERRIKPVGSNTEIEVDVRLISATNEDLTKAVNEGTFREDLYHRLNEFSLQIPSLNERKEDLHLFIEFFLEQANSSLKKNILGLSPEVSEAFKNYNWPGNLRELKNVIKRSVLLTQGEQVPIDVIPREVSSFNENKEIKNFNIQTSEKESILAALKETGYNKSKAAKLLNITRKTLYNKMEKYKLDS